MSKFFITNSDRAKIVARPDSKYHDLNKEIYFQPSVSPLISVNDYRLGSCFADLYIPTASFVWIANYDDTYSPVTLPQSVNLDVYLEEIDRVIEHSIKNIYRTHDHAVLAFSGGIDSMVLLAYIINLGYLPKTTLDIFDNTTQNHASCLHINSHCRQAVTDLLNELQGKTKNIMWSSINEEHAAEVFNTGQLQDIKCYGSKTLLKRHEKQAVIFGWHGNQALLHKDIFLDEIRLKKPSWSAQLSDYINQKQGFYTLGLKNYDVSKPPVGIEHRHLVIKPWSLLNGTNGNSVYAPFQNQGLLLLTRMLDFSSIHPDVILDAQIARKLIDSRCAWLTDFITHETVQENDSLSFFRLPADKIDQDALIIPPGLRHHPHGIDYLLTEIAQMEVQQYLAINTAVSIKSLQYIAQHFGGVSCEAT